MKTINFYELRDDASISDINSIVGCVENEWDATQWVSEDSVWRKADFQTINVCESLDELNNFRQQEKIKNLTRTFNKSEIEELRQAFEKGLL